MQSIRVRFNPIPGFLGWLVTTSSVSAQIVPDTTLPNNSTVTVEEAIQRISGGTEAGNNLFHSLDRFNLRTGETAYFDNALTIENIITRVTGGQVSNIDGLIQANGTANLFLLNPNGIVFGENARLDIGGSFLGTTADSLVFEDGSIYSATDPNAPPLLTMNVPMGLHLGANPGAIVVQGRGFSEGFPTENRGLAVTPGQTLALVGGDVTLTGGILSAPSGRIELGSIANAEVSLTPIPVGWQLGYNSAREVAPSFGTIEFLDRSSLWTPHLAELEARGGGIQVQGGRVVLDRSQIASATLGQFPGGDITLNARESLELRGTLENAFPLSSQLVNQVSEGASGQGGHIAVTTPQLTLRDGGRIQTLSFGEGDAGEVRVNAESVFIGGFGPLNSEGKPLESVPNSRISSENFAAGNGGDVNVSATNLMLLHGGQLATRAGALATGNGGQITVQVAETITATGAVDFDLFLPSGINSQSLGAGHGGDIEVSTGRLTLSEGALILSLNQGTGIGGDIEVNASESIVAQGLNPFFPQLWSGMFANTVGQADSGQVRVSTPRLSVLEGANISSAVAPQFVGVPVVEDGTGNANNVTVNADWVEVVGNSPLAPENVSQIGSSTLGTGNSGELRISTEQLSIRDGGSIATGTTVSFAALGMAGSNAGRGAASNVTIDASESIEIVGVSEIAKFPSTLGTATFGEGNTGNLEVTTPRLTVLDGGFLGSATVSGGNAGQTTIEASEIFVVGTGVSGFPSMVGANAVIPIEATRQAFFLPDFPTGNTGALTIDADRLIIGDGGLVGVQHEGTGNAGKLTVNVNELLLEEGGRIAATTASGEGGNVTIQVEDSLQLRPGSSITVEALGLMGNGGNLTIDAETIAALGNAAIVANAVGGNGGTIEISTTGLFVSPDSRLTASSQLGIDGTIELNTPDLDTSTGFVELSQATIDVEQLITQNPCQNPRDNSFIVTGRDGGLEDPRQFLPGQMLWQDWSLPPVSSPSSPSSPSSISLPPPPLVEARGWVQHPDGTIELVAQLPSARFGSFGEPTIPCGRFDSSTQPTSGFQE